ncbi:MAG TPA: IS1380 family transposase [Anaerolineales bacterium]|nr:IS1380 family transposase [Anaerolineales bacterium]
MVKNESQHSEKTCAKQGVPADSPEPYKIAASTPFDFGAKNLTPYGGLFPVATMLEKLGFKKLIEETLTIHRIPRAMTIYQFLLGMVLAIYVGFSRLNHLRFIAQDPMLTGILQVGQLPPQCTFWRFLTALPVTVAQQLLKLQRLLRERVWKAANVQLPSITLDTDTTVHTLYGQQMGARKSYNPKNKGKKSYQPILTFIAETREYIGGELRNGDRPTGAQIARHLEGVFAAVPPCVRGIFARADAGFYCWEAVAAYEKAKASFIIVARKTPRLLEELKKAHWRPSPKTDADEQCEFWYQPEGWGKAYRFIALRYQKKDETPKEQYQLWQTPEYIYRVFVTDMKKPIDLLVWVYNQRAGAENLIKEANNDAGLAAHPSRQWAANCVHFQLAMLAYNLNCWLMLFNREEKVRADELKHTTLVTARLRFLFVAAKIWRHAGRVGISYSDQYAERGLFQRLMDRLRNIVSSQGEFHPVLASALRW